MKNDVHQQFMKNGFILIENGIPNALLQDLRAATDQLLAKRDVEPNRSQTRHQTALDPDSHHPSYVNFLNLDSLNEAATAIVGREDLMFAALAVLLGARHNMLSAWHRDFNDNHEDIPALFSHAHRFIQYNCALYDDQSLWVVPGSHNRETTPAERQYLDSLTPTTEDMHAHLSGMPGAINVKLKAGDCLLYNPVIYHGAAYRPEWKRATLHGGWRDPDILAEFSSMRWGLAHNPWLLNPEYLGDLGTWFGPQLTATQAAMRQFHPDLTAA